MFYPRLFLVLATLIAVGGHPRERTTLAPPPQVPVRLGPVLFPGTGEDTVAAASRVIPSQVAVECGNEEESVGIVSCNDHCRSLRDDYRSGDCIEGRCRCKKDENRPVIKCAELAAADEDHRNHEEACKVHCQRLREGYRRGECEKGICHCRI